jgi:hypothetical protein
MIPGNPDGQDFSVWACPEELKTCQSFALGRFDEKEPLFMVDSRSKDEWATQLTVGQTFSMKTHLELEYVAHGCEGSSGSALLQYSNNSFKVIGLHKEVIDPVKCIRRGIAFSDPSAFIQGTLAPALRKGSGSVDHEGESLSRIPSSKRLKKSTRSNACPGARTSS